jgi:hypothetical protein
MPLVISLLDNIFRSIVIEESAGSRSESVEPSESRHETKEITRKRRFVSDSEFPAFPLMNINS